MVRAGLCRCVCSCSFFSLGLPVTSRTLFKGNSESHSTEYLLLPGCQPSKDTSEMMCTWKCNLGICWNSKQGRATQIARSTVNYPTQEPGTARGTHFQSTAWAQLLEDPRFPSAGLPSSELAASLLLDIPTLTICFQCFSKSKMRKFCQAQALEKHYSLFYIHATYLSSLILKTCYLRLLFKGKQCLEVCSLDGNNYFNAPSYVHLASAVALLARTLQHLWAPGMLLLH